MNAAYYIELRPVKAASQQWSCLFMVIKPISQQKYNLLIMLKCRKVQVVSKILLNIQYLSFKDI